MLPCTILRKTLIFLVGGMLYIVLIMSMTDRVELYTLNSDKGKKLGKAFIHQWNILYLGIVSSDVDKTQGFWLTTEPKPIHFLSTRYHILHIIVSMHCV